MQPDCLNGTFSPVVYGDTKYKYTIIIIIIFSFHFEASGSGTDALIKLDYFSNYIKGLLPD